MKLKKLTLTQPDERIDLPYDKERPFVKILSFKTDLTTEELDKITISFQSEIEYTDGRNHWGSFTTSDFWKPETFDVRSVKNIRLAYTLGNSEIKPSYVTIEYEIINQLDIAIPTAGFDEHLEDPKNIKILFSAPFGQGKTTFLNQYFDERLEKYNVFKLFPVNYSVASNQDIFRYIKSDILFQLLERNDLNFENIKQGLGKTFLKFLESNAHKVIAPLLMVIPQIGKSTFSLADKFNKLIDEFYIEHNKGQTDELKKGFSFVQHLIEEEGSIYEDNFYTQLIRNLVAQLKENKPEKENILIIDDLDRMDPDHIFRILNVLSAHYDTFHNGLLEENNKFGFDRIILVGDYANIKHIYEYRYGPKVDFGGYFNKYFSTELFAFDNTGVYMSLIREITKDYNGKEDDESYQYTELRGLLYALINNGGLSLRELLKLREINFQKVISQIKKPKFHGLNRWFSYGVFSPAIALLSKLGDPSLLRQKLEKIDLEQTFNLTNLNTSCIQLYAALQSGDGQGNTVYLKEGFRINFTLALHDKYEHAVITENYFQDEKTLEKLNRDAYSFTKKDFLELLMKNVTYFNTIKDRI